MGFSLRRFTTFFTFRVLGVGSGCLVGSGGLRSLGPLGALGRDRADAGSVGAFFGAPPRSRSGLVGGAFCAGFVDGSRDAGAALNFDDISGRGAATAAGFAAVFMLKLNLLGVCDCGPVGGGRLGGGISSSFGCPSLPVSSTCKSLEGLKGLSLSSIGTSPCSDAGSGWPLGDW